MPTFEPGGFLVAPKGFFYKSGFCAEPTSYLLCAISLRYVNLMRILGQGEET